MKAAISAVLEDDAFTRLQSPSAQNALASATELLQWCCNPQNHSTLQLFAANLLQQFEKVLKTSGKSQQKRREKIWKAFHVLRTSKAYEAKWVEFVRNSTSLPPCPIFYQYVSDNAFKALVKARFVVTETPASHCTQGFSYEEENALRYASGYIPRALRKKLERSAHHLKEELILCLLDLTEDQDEDVSDQSEDWTNLIDRGGLKHVNNNMYMVMLAIEVCVRKVFCKERVQEKSDHLKQQLLSDILTDENVLFHWSMLAINWDDEEANALLPLIRRYILSMVIPSLSL